MRAVNNSARFVFANSFFVTALAILLFNTSCKKEDTVDPEPNPVPDSTNVLVDTQNVAEDTTDNAADTISHSNPDPEDSVVQEPAYAMFCDDGDHENFGDEFTIENNVWGYYLSEFTDYTQCVFYDTVQPGICGWQWELTGESKMPSYPRVSFGKSPWNNSSATDVLPRTLESLTSVEVSFQQELTATGKHNTAFDIWLTRSETMTKDSISAEIMIWIEATQKCYADLIESDITIDGNTYDLYINTTWNDFPYIAFVKKNAEWAGSIDLVPFFSHLQAGGHLGATTHLAQVEFGNEIWSGSGTMVVKDFTVEIE